MHKNFFPPVIGKFLRPFAIAMLLGFVLVSCNDDDDDNIDLSPSTNLAELAATQPELSLFLTAVEQAGMSAALTDANAELTVFAPNNQAFEAFLSQAGIALGDIPQEQLQAVLQYHIVQGKRLASSLSTTSIATLEGQTIDIAVDGGVTINGSATVVEADLEATNGVIHIIDEVLMPPPPTIAALLGQESDLSILASILSRPEFSAILTAAANEDSELTVFAPTNAQFEALLTQLGKTSVDQLPEDVLVDIVTYHVLNSALASSELETMGYTSLQGEELMVNTAGGVTVNGIAVSEANLTASNGYVHKINGVLLPAEPAAVAGTVAGVAYFDANFTTLVAALKRAGLVETLLQDGPYTVFAPTNEAFESAGITDLTAFTQAELQNILLYHVVPGNITSEEVPAGVVETASGEEFHVSLTDDGVIINGMTMVTAVDIMADNGVVHVLDGVLMPPSRNIAEVVTASANADPAQFSLLLQAVVKAGLAETLAGAGPFTVFAPTDAAFEAAGFDAEAIEAASAEQLEAILLYHVVPAWVFSSDLSSGAVTTVQGGAVTIDAANLSLTDARGNVVGLNAEMLDILATNGVIHAIDAVLLPPQ